MFFAKKEIQKKFGSGQNTLFILRYFNEYIFSNFFLNPNIFGFKKGFGFGTWFFLVLVFLGLWVWIMGMDSNPDPNPKTQRNQVPNPKESQTKSFASFSNISFSSFQI